MNPALRNKLRKIKIRMQHLYYKTKDVHPTTYLSYGSSISRDIKIGAFSYFGSQCEICKHVEVGNYVMLAPNVKIVGKDHNVNILGTPMIFSGRPEHPHTFIENDVWIATRSIIMAGVTIGTGSVVAAGSIVLKDVPPNSIVAGVPAILKRKRFSDIDFEKHKKIVNTEPKEGTYCEEL